MSEIAKRFHDLFRGAEYAHGTHGEPNREPGSLKWAIRDTAKTLRSRPTVEHWDLHLRGVRPLGIIPIDANNECAWGSIDIDDYDMDPLEVIRSVEKAKMPLVPCRSKSGGLHLFLFLTTPRPAIEVQSALRTMAAKLGLAGSEIFPKQTQVLTDRGDAGSWIVMPYFGNTFGGKLQEQVGLRKTGAAMSEEEFLNFAEKNMVSPKELMTLTEVRPPRAKKQDVPFGDGPPCLQLLAARGISEHRNNALMMMGIYLKRVNPGGWQTDLERYNQEFIKEPLDSEELSSIIRSLKKKDYEYTCKIEPMVSHCDSATCRTRKYGIGIEGEYPELSGISKLDTNPPIWFVDVGDRRLEVTTDVLQNYTSFHRVCMEQTNKCYRLMNMEAWIRVLNTAMQNVVLIEAPEEMSIEGQFYELMEEFLTNRQRGDSREDLLLGRPFEDEYDAKFYFRLRDLTTFVQREGMRDMGRNRIGRLIEQRGGGRTFINVKGRGLSVWYVESDTVRPNMEVDPPPVDEDPI